MSLQFIIDAYNITNHPAFSSIKHHSQNIKISLFSFIRKHKLTGSAKNKIIMVFDGFPPSRDMVFNEDNVLAIYSQEISADEKIKMLIEESGRRKEIIVVSNDRQVQYMAGVLGARFITVEEFSAAINRQDALYERRVVEGQDKDISFVKIQRINAELKERWLKN